MTNDTLLQPTEKTATIPTSIRTVQHIATLIAAATESPLSITPDKAAAIHALSLIMVDHLDAINPRPNPT
jgi:hypothetical protein